jgi:flagellar basal body rod protein FlgG
LKNGQIQGVDATGKRVVNFNAGTFSLVTFENPARLASVDGVFFVPTAESGEPRPVKLPPNASIGVESGQLLLSNGRPDEIFARIVVLCKSKKRLVEILTQPRLAPETPTR